MSFFGYNIKKIREVKKISQKDFAELFDLTRSAVGSYEEGRAEPKIDKIIEIAKYFNLTLDQLLTKKLTVNEILKFKPNYLDKTIKIPLLRQKDLKKYFKYSEQAKLTEKFHSISLPSDIFDVDIAFEIDFQHQIFHKTFIFCSEKIITSKNYYYFGLNEDNAEILENYSADFKKVWTIKYVLFSDLSKLKIIEKLADIEDNLLTFNQLLKLKLNL